ncbi:MAG: hypothetical protein ACOWWR_07825 [Eubacteriales bacterium]
MIKCERCGYTNEKVSVPMVCPKCGNIAKPYIIKEKKKKDNAISIEEVVLEKLED